MAKEEYTQHPFRAMSVFSCKGNREGQQTRRGMLLIGALFFMVSTATSCDRVKSTERQTVERQKLNYELQERCGKRAEQIYKERWDLAGRNYQNHYNARLNKCFMWVVDSAAEYLIDINENNQSMFANGRCIITPKNKIGECNYDEWTDFVKSMMEETAQGERPTGR